MKRLLTLLLLGLPLIVSAQNPIIRDQFSADPTARVFNNKVYLYPSHDIKPPVGQRQDWFCMEDYHVFSSENLTDWTDHGMIVTQNKVPWVRPDSYSMWAPDCVYRNGKYYFYFPSTPAGGMRGFGVGVAIALAVIRTIFNFSILYYMIPGYIISLTLMFVCPDIFTAMAFDSGGTASGPMASSFVLPMVVGLTTAIYAENANYFDQSFGVIALIALTPIIAIQVLGVTEKIKDARAKYVMRKHVYNAEDAQIIHFN